MTRCFFTIFGFMFLSIFPMIVYADIVVTSDRYTELIAVTNRFFQHNETTWLGRNFVVSSLSDVIMPREVPGSPKGVPMGHSDGSDRVRTFKNCEIIYIARTYCHEGECWGILWTDQRNQAFGWVPLDELRLLYDRSDFEKANDDSFYTYTGGHDPMLAGKSLLVWQWPGSDREKLSIGQAILMWYGAPRTLRREAERRVRNEDIIREIRVRRVYRDEEGREWGEIDITFANPHRSDGMQTVKNIGWICLTDPANRSIPAFNPAPEPIKWLPGGNYDWPPVGVVKNSHETKQQKRKGND